MTQSLLNVGQRRASDVWLSCLDGQDAKKELKNYVHDNTLASLVNWLKVK